MRSFGLNSPISPFSSRPFRLWFCIAAGSVAAALLLSGCGGKKSAFEGTGSPKYTGPDPIPIGGGHSKLGKPYSIAGKRYRPKADPDYNETGIASWYGPKFHRRMTSNGEWFDMNRITAAHKTLPMPSFVRVTNLKNGRSLVARLNDRGPYAHDRIIDMSRRAAQMLGFRRQGTAPVRVEYLGPAPMNGDDYYAAQRKLNGQKVARSAKRNLSGRRPARRYPELLELASAGPEYSGASTDPALIAGNALYVQAGSFTDPANARRAERRLSSIGAVETVRAVAGPTVFYRVRVGPLPDVGRADDILSRVITAGHHDARIIAR